MIKKVNRAYNGNGQVLISSNELIGSNTAYEADNLIYVSPAIFQLLTDDRDQETAIQVALQIEIKPLACLVSDIVEGELDKVLK